MKNRVNLTEARMAAGCLKLDIEENDFKGFSHVADFTAESGDGDGNLMCDDSCAAVSAFELCREEIFEREPVSRRITCASKLAETVYRGEKKAVSIVREYLRQAKESKNGTYITVMEAEAERIAEQLDRRTDCESLPLAGVPLSVKDNICIEGILTTCASRALEDFVPTYSSTVYLRLIAAGAVPVGKTNMDEFAVGADGSTSYFGPCRNPLDPSLSPGGSSSGSAASLAEGSAVISLGSDTGGSARIPASYCGLAALKPTYGAFSRWGLVGMAPSLEQICPMARCVSDVRLMFEIASGHDARDMTTCVTWEKRRRKGRIGVFMPSEVSETARKAVERCVALLKVEGYEADRVELPFFDEILGVYYTISSAEAASNLARFDGLRYGYRSEKGDILSTRNESFGAPLRERLAEGAYVLSEKSGGAYARALHMREQIKEKLNELFGDFDLLVTPMSDTEAASFGETVCTAERYAVYANLAGIPALTFPAVRGERGLPVGVQLMGAAGDDIFVLETGEAVEGRLAW